jgi:hypothetical protein
MLLIRFEKDFCDQELTNLHLSFIVLKIYRFIFLLIFPTLLVLCIKRENRCITCLIM